MNSMDYPHQGDHGSAVFGGNTIVPPPGPPQLNRVAPPIRPPKVMPVALNPKALSAALNTQVDLDPRMT